MTQPTDAVLEVQNLSITYETSHGDVRAVRDVSFSIEQGETFGIVGESGCGKSTLAFAVMRYLTPNARIDGGRIWFEGENLLDKPEDELLAVRGTRISMVYQDPMSALNPTMKVGRQLSEVLTEHEGLGRREAQRRCVEILEKVHMGDPEVLMDRYPHQLSGGQQQRVLIAMALLTEPALLVMDEPTTGLDVTVQAGVLDLVELLKDELRAGILYITHDLGVVARVCDRMGVMYAGEMIELGTVRQILSQARHPYTEALLRAVPRIGSSKATSVLNPIEGQVPSPAGIPDGCAFAPRCRYAEARCRDVHPDLSRPEPDRLTRCLLADRVGTMSEMPRLREPGRSPDDEDVEKRLTLVDLDVYYPLGRTIIDAVSGREPVSVRAVDGISLDLSLGQTLGVVGESGCGKSTLAKAIVGLQPITGGRIEFLGIDISTHAGKRSREVLRELQMVFQNPDSTLNPAYSIGDQIARPIKLFGTVPRREVGGEVDRLLEAVRLGGHYRHRFPAQLSGGEKQRAAIARALAGRPKVLVCDEPTSALDVSVQAAVLNLLLEIQEESAATMILISHDLSVVRFFADHVAVMYLGHILECGETEAVFQPPYAPYTEALLSAVPVWDVSAQQRQIRLEGPVPSALAPPPGCPFQTRCHRAIGDRCTEEFPPIQRVNGRHFILCHIPVARLADVEPVVTVPA